jgi:hypothetical protein
MIFERVSKEKRDEQGRVTDVMNIKTSITAARQITDPVSIELETK